MVLFGMGLSELNLWGSLREGHIRMGLNGVNHLNIYFFLISFSQNTIMQEGFDVVSVVFWGKDVNCVTII